MRFSKSGDPLVPGYEPLLAPGVQGTAFDTPEGIYIPLVRAKSEGSGDVGRFLDSLPTDRRICFPGVINHRLAGMLERRGFFKGIEPGNFGEPCVVFQRCPQ